MSKKPFVEMDDHRSTEIIKRVREVLLEEVGEAEAYDFSRKASKAWTREDMIKVVKEFVNFKLKPGAE